MTDDRENFDKGAGEGKPPTSKPPWPGALPEGEEYREPETDPDARNMAVLCHLLGAFLGILGPLVIWLMKKDEFAYVDDQGKEALNFHITLLIAYGVSVAAYIVISLITCGFGAFLFVPALVGIAQVVLGIMASMEASKGQYYRYPFNMRFMQ